MSEPAPASPGPRPGRPEAARWDWWRTGPAAPPVDLARSNRRGALIQGAIAAAAGAVLRFGLGRPTLAAVAWTLGGLLLLVGLVSPAGAYERVRHGLTRFGELVGRILGVVLLVPLYFLFFALFGLLFRRGRRDPLERWFDPAQASYWKQRPARPVTLRDYERQF